MRTAWTRTLTALACVLLVAGILAGVANRQVLDGSRFAAHADAIRMDDHVSEQIGTAISNKVIDLDPDLVALRPAVEAVIVQLVRGSSFTPVVEAAVRQVHDALTRPASGQILLRLADLSAVVVAALKTVAPNVAARLPADFDVRLADLGSQTFAAQVLHVTRLVGLLAWLLPTLALLCLIAAIGLARRRQRALAMVGLGLGAAGLVIGILCVGAATYASAADTNALRGALTAAVWGEFGPSFWHAAAILLVCGCVVFAAAGAYLPEWSIWTLERRVIGWVRSPGRQPVPQVATGTALVGVGAFAVYRPLAVARVVTVLLGLAVLAEGIARISRVSAQLREADELAHPGHAPRERRRWAAGGIAVAGALGLAAYLVVSSLPSDRRVAVASRVAATVDPRACNGHVELCARRYDQVATVATHNAMSAADNDGWFIPEQPTGLAGQLDAGVRTLLIDTWYGQQTDRPGVIATAQVDREQTIDAARREYGATVVDSALRLRSALNLTPRGPAEPYLCHRLCELGSTPMLPAMKDVRVWLAGHRREVVTFIIEDNVSPDDTAKLFDEAGLTSYVHEQRAGRSWPTLGQMIDSGQRLVVFMQRRGGGSAHPWLLKAFDWIQDTPYDNKSAAALSCARLRGDPSNSLLLVNNILTRFATRVSDSSKINAFGALWPYANRCERERRQIPNFVAVDYFDKGDVFRIVDRLNGVQ